VPGIEIDAGKASAAARGLHDGLVVRGGYRPIGGRKGVFCEYCRYRAGTMGLLRMPMHTGCCSKRSS
jgi:hypothetical protein